MYTQTIIPKSNRITIQLPKNFVGEEVRLIAIIEKSKTDESERFQVNNPVHGRYSKYPRVDLSSFKFNRDEANDF